MKKTQPGKVPEGRLVPATLSAGKRRLFRIVLLTVVPAVLLLSLEVILRIVGYGIPSSYFVKWKGGGDVLHVANRRYAEHFVPPGLSRAPESSAIGAKAPGTFRVLVLGSSAANGDPDPSYGFCRMLERLLNEHSGATRFEVVNAAITAMNSHVARNIAQDAAGHGVDVFLVYTGNNEVVGPYGPSSVAGRMGSSRLATVASIWIKKETKTGQLLNQFARSIASGKEGSTWLGMESFLNQQVAHDDPRLKSAYRNFQSNLESIVRAAAKQQAQVLLATVPTNLRSCAPFASRHRDGLGDDGVAEWNRSFEAGRTLEQARDFDAALDAYGRAFEIDASHAGLRFSMARCHERLDRFTEAKEHYTAARDLDALRFRADSRINEIIREVAGNSDGQRVRLLDLEGAIEADAPHRIAGERVLFDHVHLNSRGNFLAALTAVGVLREALPSAGIQPLSAEVDDLYSSCRESLLYDGLAEYRTLMMMYRRKTLPPFAGQLDHVAELARLKQLLVEDRMQLKAYTFDLATQKRHVDQHPGDPYLLPRYLESLVASGAVKEAVAVSEAALNAAPWHTQLREEHAKLLATHGSRDQAVALLMDRSAPFPLDREAALFVIGTEYIHTGNIRAATEVFHELNRIDPENVEYLVNLASAAAKQGNESTARRRAAEALKLDPTSRQAMIRQANHFARAGQAQEAQKWFAKAVEDYPYEYQSQFGLGVQEIRAGRGEAGIRHLENAVRLKPDFVEGYRTLAEIARNLGNQAAAEANTRLSDLFAPPLSPY